MIAKTDKLWWAPLSYLGADLRILTLALALLMLSGCDRFEDHPERFVRVHTQTGPNDKISVYEHDGYLKTEGVMTIDGPDKIAAPINLTTIECHRDDATASAYCEATRAEILTMKGNGTYLMSRDDLYIVKEWSMNRVVAIMEEPCRTNELRIDIPGNAVTEVTENTPGGSCDGALTGPVSQTRIARLISGTQLERMKGEL